MPRALLPAVLATILVAAAAASAQPVEPVLERARNQLLPEAKVEVQFDRGRPPLAAPPGSAALARHAQGVFREIGRELSVAAAATGGGTDAAFAAAATRSPVVEGWGLRGFGAHSPNAEYIDLDSIEPRLYLAARIIMDLSRGKVPTE